MSTLTLDPGPQIWRSAGASFLPHARRSHARQVLRYLPVAAILLLQVLLTLHLHNVAFPDEALYIDAGHAYFIQWTGGPSAPDYGSYFSGLPYAYPVAAAILDHIGGLSLVRNVNLTLLLGANLCVGSVSRHLAPPNHRRAAGLLGMVLFATASSTAFVGHFATFDAPCVFFCALAMMLAICVPSTAGAVGAGLSIAAASVLKYTGGVFIPVIVLLMLLASPKATSGVRRAVIVALTAGAGILDVFIQERSAIQAGISFTTTSRVAENYRSHLFLAQQFALGGATLCVFALVGVFVSVRLRRGPKTMGLLIILIAAGLIVPVSQFRIHEYTSFNKHLVFLALFLSPVGAQVALIRHKILRFLIYGPGLYVVLILGIIHADFMFGEWPNPSSVIKSVNQHNIAGTYIGLGADTATYYERARPAFKWEEPYALFGAGPSAIKNAVAGDEFAGVFYTSGSSGSASLDASDAVLAHAVASNPDYYLAGSWPKHKYDLDRYYLWLRKAPPATAGS